MKPDAADNSVPREISVLFSNQRLILRETQRAVTPMAGVPVFVAFLHKLGFVEKLRRHMPMQWKSLNQIDPSTTFTAFLVAVLAGAKSFAHANWLRNDRALHALLGLSRFPVDHTIRNLFRRFGMGDVHRRFDPPWSDRRMLAHFAIRGLMHEAALQAKKDPDQLSFLHAVRLEGAISADVALRLGKYFGMTPQFWMNLQTDYDLRIAATTGPPHKIKTRKAA